MKEGAPLEEDGGKKEWQGEGEMAIPDIGNPDGYQEKGVVGEAKRIVIKTKGIGNVAQIWARGRGQGCGPSRTSLGVNKSGVEQFEWSLITLVSLTWLVVLSQ